MIFASFPSVDFPQFIYYFFTGSLTVFRCPFSKVSLWFLNFAKVRCQHALLFCTNHDGWLCQVLVFLDNYLQEFSQLQLCTSWSPQQTRISTKTASGEVAACLASLGSSSCWSARAPGRGCPRPPGCCSSRASGRSRWAGRGSRSWENIC